MSEKPEALRLAGMLQAQADRAIAFIDDCRFQAAAELRRLHADNERLRDELLQSGIDHTRAEVERLKAERDEAVRAEREACAKVCEQLVSPYAESVGSLRHATLACATAIRERGQEPPR